MKSIISIFVFIATNSFMHGQQWTTSGNSITNPNTEFLGTSSGQDLVLKTNNTEAMRITSNQNVGIGTTSPGNKLEVSGGTLGGVRLEGVLNAHLLTTNTNGDIEASTFLVHSDGDIKHALIAADHEGWVLLGPGRSIASLKPGQQAVATSLGLFGDLPDATDAYFSQTSVGALTAVSGATDNQVAITQRSLPQNLILTTTTGVQSQKHTHTVTVNGVNHHSHTYLTYNGIINDRATGNPNSTSFWRDPVGGTTYGDAASNTDGSHFHTLTTSENSVTHTHTFTTNTLTGGPNVGDIPQVPLDVRPWTIKANAFIWLGVN